MEDLSTLKALVDWLLRAGAAYLAFWLVEQMRDDLLVGLTPEQARYVSFVVAGLFGLLAWAIGLEFGYIERPVGDWHAWVEGGAGVVLTVVLGAQAVHGRARLSATPRIIGQVRDK